MKKSNSDVVDYSKYKYYKVIRQKAFRSLIKFEVERAKKIMSDSNPSKPFPKIYWDDKPDNFSAAHYNIPMNVIAMSKYFRDLDKIGVAFTCLNAFSFVTSLRHELAHYYVGRQHNHSDYRFKYLLAKLEGSKMAGTKIYELGWWEKVCFFFSRKCFTKKGSFLKYFYKYTLDSIESKFISSFNRFFVYMFPYVFVLILGMFTDPERVIYCPSIALFYGSIYLLGNSIYKNNLL